MKQKIITVVMIIAALLLPMGSSAKGPAVNVVLKDANGVTVGSVIGMETIGWPYVLTDQGYRTFFRIGKGMVTLFPDEGVGFAEAGCKGMAYVGRGMFLGAVFLPTPDFNGFYGSGALLYTPSDALREMVNIKSKRHSDGAVCEEFGIDGVDAELYPAYLNDPSITGIENTVYPERMLIE